MADDKNKATNDTNITNILSAIQNWVVAQSNLTKQFTSIVSSNHINVSLSGVALSSAITSGTVTTINTSIGLTGGPITTTGTLAVSLPKLTASTSADIALNNTANYFDGPTVTQGSSGVWFASGTVTISSTAAGGSNIMAKLWDGTTIIASCENDQDVTGGRVAISLSGVLTSPSSNIKISVRDQSDVVGKIIFNVTGNSKDSTITAVRIG